MCCAGSHDVVVDMYPERSVGGKGLGDGFGKSDFDFQFDDGEVNSSVFE